MSDLQEKIDTFKSSVWEYYRANKRQFAWRDNPTQYGVVVSEIMLQQTQTSRVKEKYDLFLQTFPSFKDLAQADVSEVVRHWIGLGYNRRALALHGIAQRIITEYQGRVPDDVEILKTFKGLGHATASSIVAFAHNKSTVFIETNIRAVFLHIFYPQQEEVHDKELMPFVELSVDQINPREWYYALMDYGVYLKKLHKNPNKKSRHYTIQSKFEGSDRQIRGAIVKAFENKPTIILSELKKELPFDSDRIKIQYKALIKEGFFVKNKK